MSIHIYDRNTFGKVLSNSLVEGRMVANLEDEALQPSPSFELFQERSMFLFNLKKKPWPFNSTTSAKSQMWWLYNRSSIFALVAQEFPHCFCCFCRCAFRLPFKKSAQQCWAYLPQIVWGNGTSNGFWGMRFTYPGQHDWGILVKAALGFFHNQILKWSRTWVKTPPKHIYIYIYHKFVMNNEC